MDVELAGGLHFEFGFKIYLYHELPTARVHKNEFNKCITVRKIATLSYTRADSLVVKFKAPELNIFSSGERS